MLESLETPADLKRLPPEQLEGVCEELRSFIIEQLSHEPGHLASSLGVVELTVALHYVYNTPGDQLLWDVGHQAYGHKILTGRRRQFDTLRQLGGLSGFPSRAESEYDAFGAGHASTSISAALGMATAFRLRGETERKVVCVIGDGAMTGGEAFEGLNNMAGQNDDLLVVLNDNQMSIDQATGALSQYLLDITTGSHYNRLRGRLQSALMRRNPNRGPLTRFTNTVKGLLTGGTNMFEGLNIRYFGPCNGHDVRYLVELLRDLRELPGPKLLHVLTVKGKGFAAAEKNPTQWHSVSGAFDPKTGDREPGGGATAAIGVAFQDVAGETALELARANRDVVAITPAMASGSGLTRFFGELPERSFDVGICEEHAVTFAAGLAAQGLRPLTFVYSTFAQRAFDQIIHDVALQRLPVVLCLDRAGLVGADGPTHHGVFDLPLLLSVPNVTICSPYDERDLCDLLRWAVEQPGPVCIRYPRGRGSVAGYRALASRPVTPGKARLLRAGTDAALLSFGPIGTEAAAAAIALEKKGIHCAHYDLRFAKPLDTALLEGLFDSYTNIVSLEDGVLTGGVGSAIRCLAQEKGYGGRLTTLGVPDAFVMHGSVSELRRLCQMDAFAVEEAVLTTRAR